ncbi:MAG: hydroxymethylglutaryl-CoA lyase [Burkholderiales bacterium]
MTRLHIHEVVTRDGLQMEPRFVPTEKKIELIDQLSLTGLSKIEVTSFVSAKAIPMLADAEAVMAGITRKPGVKYVALIANVRGVERAIAAKVDEVVLVVSISESHNRANVRRSVDASFDGFAEIKRALEGTGIGIAAGMATTFGCPFEGFQPLDRILGAIQRFVDLGITSLGLADTTGMGNPTQVLDISQAARAKFPQVEFALHFHNTRGMGLANVVSGLQAGIRRYESSLGGLGGCPYAPGATGNICTEDLVHMLESMGHDTGVDLARLLEASRLLRKTVEHELPGQVVKAGRSIDLHPMPQLN